MSCWTERIKSSRKRGCYVIHEATTRETTIDLTSEPLLLLTTARPTAVHDEIYRDNHDKKSTNKRTRFARMFSALRRRLTAARPRIISATQDHKCTSPSADIDSTSSQVVRQDKSPEILSSGSESAVANEVGWQTEPPRRIFRNSIRAFRSYSVVDGEFFTSSPMAKSSIAGQKQVKSLWDVELSSAEKAKLSKSFDPLCGGGANNNIVKLPFDEDCRVNECKVYKSIMYVNSSEVLNDDDDDGKVPKYITTIEVNGNGLNRIWYEIDSFRSAVRKCELFKSCETIAGAAEFCTLGGGGGRASWDTCETAGRTRFEIRSKSESNLLANNKCESWTQGRSQQFFHERINRRRSSVSFSSDSLNSCNLITVI